MWQQGQAMLVVVFTSVASGGLWPALASEAGGLRTDDLHTGGLQRPDRGG